MLQFYKLTYARFELVLLAANAGGLVSSSDAVSGSSLNSIKSVFTGEQCCLSERALIAGMRPMPSRWSMRSGTAVSETQDRLMKSIDDGEYPPFLLLTILPLGVYNIV